MVLTNNLSFCYPDSPVLSFPDLVLGKGESLLICGESGCGKTTLLHLLGGLKKPSSGSITISGKEITHFSSSKMDHFRGSQIGFIYQQPHFIQALSIRDNLLISPYCKDPEKVKTIAKRLSIDKILSRYPYQLSEGQKQRATIARAIMNQPKLLLADEPTSALDNKNCKVVIDLLKEEAAINNAALIIVTHDTRLRSEINNNVELSALKAG